MHTNCPLPNRLQQSAFHDFTAVLLVTPAVRTVMLHCPSDPSVTKHCAAVTFQGQAVQTLNHYLSKHNQIPFIVQNKMFWLIAGHFQVHSWSSKHKKHISSPVCFEDQLWTWHWPEIGWSILFCTINRIWLCMDRYWFNVGTINNTGCHRRKGPNFGRVFLMLNYTDITQNTYIQSWTVSEIMESEVWNFDRCYTLTDCQIHTETGRNMRFL